MNDNGFDSLTIEQSITDNKSVAIKKSISCAIQTSVFNILLDVSVPFYFFKFKVKFLS